MEFLESFKRKIELSSDEVDIIYEYSIGIDQLRLVNNAIKFAEHPDPTRDRINKEVRAELDRITERGIAELERMIKLHLDMKHRIKVAKDGGITIDESAVNPNEPPRKEMGVDNTPSPIDTRPKLSFNFKRK